ncbi:hypothetical protein J1N35_044990 [Gossypium stocksii]|uniref:Uncharacterized protein n=1 Tax=Gossypium stocksii TaxID=47602 RepID=A0A9D3UA37_9ROSI|nr:hypothetical protein J1N35_044990 [Gossypium stocksii]
MKIKGYCDNLASCREVISEHEHVTAILNGLSPDCESVITIITGVTTMLLDAEGRQHVTIFEASSSANMVSHQSAASTVNSISTPAYRLSSTARNCGRGHSYALRIQCQLCEKAGHFVDCCYYQFDTSYKSVGYRPPSQVNICIVGAGSFIVSWVLSFMPMSHSAIPHSQPAPQSQVYVATPKTVGDNSCYPDSGATYHLTHSAAPLDDSTSYNGPVPGS